MEFASNFFEKEVREGFEVPEMMKRAWAAQMEVLQVVADVCDKNGIQYFADWGTLLGAARHKGFIPWDDDIDICLRREEYNKLVQILPWELPYGFVMVGTYSQDLQLRKDICVPQLRVVADERLWKFNDYVKYFHGFPYGRVGIDIFQLDYIPKEDEVAEIQKIILRQGVTLLRDWNKLEISGELEVRIKEFEELCNVKLVRNGDIQGQILRLIDSVTSLYSSDEAEYMTNYVFWILDDNYKLKKEWYTNVVMLPFENIEIPVPAMWDEVLKAQFGDYMVPVRTVTHNYPFYECQEEKMRKWIEEKGYNESIDEFCRDVYSGKLIII